jgi:hypothetical protein
LTLNQKASYVTPIATTQKADEQQWKSYPIETKKSLDKFLQYPYYSSKGISDSKLVFDLQAQ